MGGTGLEVTDKLKRIRLLLLDVDGVLTDGSITYNDSGAEAKVFNVKDGLGLRLLMDAGINVCIVTGRISKALRHRCKDLRIDHVFEGVREKDAVLDSILEQTGVPAEGVAFVGDDLIDLPLMKKIGVAIAVADAHEAVLDHAAMVTSAVGGAGAVREVCEAILKAQGLWDNILGKYM